MAFTLNDLNSAGAFVATAPVKRTITFTLDDGEERSGDIHVKRLSIGDHEKLFLGAPDKESRTALLISEVITLGEDGTEKISFQQAYQLHPSIAGAMIQQFNEVNSGAKKN